MDFKEAVKGLAVEEAAALKVLERAGWQIGMEVRVEDMRLPNGMRRRTFSNQGRYAFAVLLKNPSSREGVEVPAFAAVMDQGLEADQAVTVVPVAETIGAKSEVTVTLESIDPGDIVIEEQGGDADGESGEPEAEKTAASGKKKDKKEKKEKPKRSGWRR